MNCDKRKIRNDILLVAILLAVISAAGLVFFFLRGEGDTVEVTVDGQPFGTYSLERDVRVAIVTERGSNTLVIRDGRAWVEEASCPDGICAAHRPIKRSGESIVCLPNKVVVTVRSAGAESPDVIS